MRFRRMKVGFGLDKRELEEVGLWVRVGKCRIIHLMALQFTSVMKKGETLHVSLDKPRVSLRHCVNT